MTDAEARGDRIFVLASHPASGFSMQRYSNLLKDGYIEAGHQVECVRPTNLFSKRISNHSLRKFWVYIENLVVFPLRITLLPRDSIIHIADHSDAFWALALKFSGKRRVAITCHDLIAVRAARGELPEHLPRYTGRVFQRLVRFGLKHTSWIFCVSGTTENDVKRLVRSDRTSILFNPIDPRMVFKQTGTGPERPFLLVVSSAGWRKRRERAVIVWKHLQAVMSDDLRLVIVGPCLSSHEYPDDQHGIEYLDHITDLEMASLYENATALLQQSKYEGFGWPIVEANHQGTPAICSDLEIFREVGPSNVFLPEDLRDVDWEIVGNQIRHLRDSPKFAVDMERFTWSNFVKQLKITDSIHA